MILFNPDRIAFEALQKIKDAEPHATRNAALSLAHHLRAHGLSATVGYGMANDDKKSKAVKAVAQAFVDALDTACPLGGADITAKAQSLKTEATATYLLHSRLALPLADGFALAAKAFWPTEDSTPKHTEQETAHG